MEYMHISSNEERCTDLYENPQMLQANLMQIQDSSTFIKSTPMLWPIVIGRITWFHSEFIQIKKILQVGSSKL